ncbi:MAG: PP0621 family protein [Burkholderiaceae bacterium]
MGKLIFWVGVIAIVWGGARFLSILQRKQESARQLKAERDNQQEAVVRCATCGVYIPASDAVKVGKQAYYCPEHRPRS